MPRALSPLRLLSAALDVVEGAAVLAVWAVVVVRALARGARPEAGPDDDCDAPPAIPKRERCACGRDDVLGPATGRCANCWMRYVSRNLAEDELANDDCDEPGRARGGPGVIDACGGAADCQHTSIHPDPDRPGHDRCGDCGETDFSATPEAAGACPACGEYGDCSCAPAGPRPHCATWVVLPSGRTIGMSPLGDPLKGGEA